MRIAILYPVAVFYDGRSYTTNTDQHRQFPYLRSHFDEMDLVVFLKRTTRQRGQETVQAEGMRILGLPFCDSGFQMYLTRVLLWLPALLFHIWRHRKVWDVVLLYNLVLPNQVAYVCCRLLGVRMVLLVGGRHADGLWLAHHGDPAPKRWVVWLYARWVAVVERFLLGRLPSVADYVPEHLVGEGVQANRGRLLLYVGSVVSEQDIEPRRRACPSDAIRVLSVGRVVPIKGFEYLIEAVSLLCRGGRDVYLDIVGPLYGESYNRYEERLRCLVDQLGLEGRVRLCGPLPFGGPLMEAYRAADIFAMSSLSEGIPKVLCEAMAKGLPIVATRVGGIPWLLEETGAGVLVQPADSSALADGIWAAYQNRQEIATCALQAARRFTAEAQMQRVAAFVQAAALVRGGRE